MRFPIGHETRKDGHMQPRKRTYYKANVKPTERDMALFEYIGTHGCASAEQIHALFWSGRKYRTCRERLTLLTKGGFVHTMTTSCRGRGEEVFWIEKKASLLFEREVRQGFELGCPNKSELAHVLHTNEALDRLGRKGNILSWKRERLIKSVKAQTASPFQAADAQVTMDVNGKRYNFSIEIDGKYHGKQLAEKIQDYGTSKRPVVWIVYTKARLTRLANLCKDFTNIRIVNFDSL